MFYWDCANLAMSGVLGLGGVLNRESGVCRHHVCEDRQGLGHSACSQSLWTSPAVCLRAQGSLPPEWGAAGAFPALRYLEVSSNFRLGGALPGAWGSSANSMQRLQVSALSAWQPELGQLHPKTGFAMTKSPKLTSQFLVLLSASLLVKHRQC